MRKIPWYIILLVFFFGLYGYALYKRPVKTNWTPTLVNRDKIPYGSFVLFTELKNYFGTTPAVLRITPYEQCREVEDRKALYMFICPDFKSNKTDEQELMKFLGEGNTVFISAAAISQTFADTLGLTIGGNMLDMNAMSGEPLGTRLVNPRLFPDRYFTMPGNTINGTISKFDTTRTVVMGMNVNNKVNFIMMKIGKGKLFVHVVPAMFSNYSMLDGGNRDYVSGVLSLISTKPSAVYWDEYFKQGRVGADSPLRVILEHPALKAGFFTALLSILAFMIFQSKRRQRIIPVIVPPENSTVDFVETVSQVYFNNRNHRNIGMKQITYLFEHIRSAYNLDTSMPDDAFAKRLAHKSGMPEDEALAMMRMIRLVRSEEKIGDQHLLKLNNYIQQFHKYSNQ